MKRAEIFKTLKNRVRLMDGAIGTQLQAMGLKPGESPEAWNLDFPERIRAMHRSYLDAGAQALTTNSFGGHPERLKRAGLSDKAARINMRAASLAREEAAGSAWVAGSVGPTGLLLAPLGEAQPDDVRRGFLLQIKALADGGADLIVVETMSSLDEAVLAVEAARELDVPVIASMTFNPTKIGYRTVMGVSIQEAVQGLLRAGADGVGSNCGNGIEDFIPIVREMRLRTDVPILAEANAGVPELVDGRTVYRESPESMASRVADLVAAGANLVGGCCGTTPEHIRRMAMALESDRKKPSSGRGTGRAA